MAVKKGAPKAIEEEGGVATPARSGGGDNEARSERWRPFLLAMMFLAPALIIMGFLVVYPIFFSIYRSLYDQGGHELVGVATTAGCSAAPRRSPRSATMRSGWWGP